MPAEGQNKRTALCDASIIYRDNHRVSHQDARPTFPTGSSTLPPASALAPDLLVGRLRTAHRSVCISLVGRDKGNKGLSSTERTLASDSSPTHHRALLEGKATPAEHDERQ